MAARMTMMELYVRIWTQRASSANAALKSNLATAKNTAKFTVTSSLTSNAHIAAPLPFMLLKVVTGFTVSLASTI